MEKTERNMSPSLRKTVELLSSHGTNFVVGRDGAIRELANTCIIDFVNCNTKEKQTVTLQKGEEIYYGDWDGTACIRRVFTC